MSPPLRARTCEPSTTAVSRSSFPAARSSSSSGCARSHSPSGTSSTTRSDTAAPVMPSGCDERRDPAAHSEMSCKRITGSNENNNTLTETITATPSMSVRLRGDGKPTVHAAPAATETGVTNVLTGSAYAVCANDTPVPGTAERVEDVSAGNTAYGWQGRFPGSGNASATPLDLVGQTVDPVEIILPYRGHALEIGCPAGTYGSWSHFTVKRITSTRLDPATGRRSPPSPRRWTSTCPCESTRQRPVRAAGRGAVARPRRLRTTPRPRRGPGAAPRGRGPTPAPTSPSPPTRRRWPPSTGPGWACSCA